jgi:hypothetical protein
MQLGGFRAFNANEALARGMLLVASDIGDTAVAEMDHDAALLRASATNNLLFF